MGDHFEISFEGCFFICFLAFTLISYNLPFNLSNALIKKKVPYCIFFSKRKVLRKKENRGSLQTANFPPFRSLPIRYSIRNQSIYNILRWVAWTMGQTNRRPRVWCSKYYFSYIFYRLRALKTLYFYFCNFMKK